MLATLVVAVAVATMVALGFWQLGRRLEKQAQVERYAQAQARSSDVAWPGRPGQYDKALYRHSRIDCLSVAGIDPVAGRSAEGETGWAHVARCRLADRSTANVALGWSRDPRSPAWDGGEVGGFIGPYGRSVKLVAAPPQAGLAQLAAPDPRDVPNNHLSYAVQWFLFALTALVVYVLALRRKWRG